MRYKRLEYEGVEYKSGFEVAVARALTERSCPFEYESIRVDYWLEIPRGYCAKCLARSPRINRVYTPDFVLPSGVIIEAKGKFSAADRKKHAAIKEQHPDLDLRLLFSHNNWVTRKHKQRYSDWCARKDIKFHVGLNIPKEWLRK